MRPILFIDRDGVVLEEPNSDYQIDSVDKTRFVKGAISNLHKIAAELGYYKVMVSNQDGLGTASYPKEQFEPYQNLMIDTLAKEGFVPIRIRGKKLQASNAIEIDSSLSSQYISALLLIGSQMEGGLSLNLNQSRVSNAYIQMTISLLNQAGIIVSDHQDSLHITPQKIQAHTFYIEPDWSSASYWYAIKALGYSGNIFLTGLKKNSTQGDACIAKLMENYGVQTIYHEGGIEIISGTICKEDLLIDCIDCPDLAPTLIATAAAMRLPYRFTGLQTLAHKESNRTEALRIELAKIGAELKEAAGICFINYTHPYDFTKALVFDTHQDHRMAMCLAPLALQWPHITIHNAAVVEKSYRSFWDDFAQTGLSLNLQ